jgi:hypothetical protein
MKRSALLAYQWLTGMADILTGILLYVAPGFVLRMLGVHAPADTLPYISYIGAFVFSVGLACLYGALLVRACACVERIETVWILTGFTRAAVAVYVLQAIVTGKLEAGWISVAAFDGACALVQGIGLRRKWLKDAK